MRQSFGVAGGLATLSPTLPFDQARPFGSTGVRKAMIVLTDGDNTRNRFTGDTDQIDERTRLACKRARDKDIELYTIRVIEGNRSLLRGCASGCAALTGFEAVSN